MKEDDSIVQLEACEQWQTMYEFAMAADLRRKWSLRFFVLSDSGVVSLDFVPKNLLVESLRFKQSILFWTGNDGPKQSPHPWKAPKRPPTGACEGGSAVAGDDAELDAGDVEMMHDLFGDSDDGMEDQDLFSDQDLGEAGLALEAEGPSEAADVAIAEVGLAGEVEPRGAGEAAVEPRGAGEVEVVFLVLGGTLAYYSKRNRFYAYCQEASHGKSCRLERTAHAGKRKGQGRPVGLLMAWLQDGARHANQKDHVNSARGLGHAQRVAGRQHFETLASARELLMHEAGYVDGVRGEPDELP